MCRVLPVHPVQPELRVLLDLRGRRVRKEFQGRLVLWERLDPQAQQVLKAYRELRGRLGLKVCKAQRDRRDRRERMVHLGPKGLPGAR